MNLPPELVVAFCTLFAGQAIAFLGFTYRKLSAIDNRLTRVETLLGGMKLHVQLDQYDH